MENIKEKVHEDFVKLKDNREKHFDEFYKNNYNLVYRICYSILKNKENSEDITQNIFVKIYKMQEEKLPSEYEASWLYTVSKNETLQFLRSKKDNFFEDELDKQKSNSSEIENVIDKQDYEEIVKKLNKKQEQIVSLKVISDFTFKEIGQIMSMPTATVQWHYYSSIKYLKVAMSNFAMFLVAFVVGMGVFNRNKQEDEESLKSNKQNKVDYSTDKSEENKENYDGDYSISSEVEVDKSENVITSEKNEGLGNMDSITESVVNVDRETVKTHSNSHIGIFCVAGAFLIISLIFSIFFINYKQKLCSKSSKR